MMMKPLLSHYQTEGGGKYAGSAVILNVQVVDEDDEYTLMGIIAEISDIMKTNTEGVETFALTSLKNIPKARGQRHFRYMEFRRRQQICFR
ncbi:MAG: hypothetical protein ACLTZM_02520 [Ruminococcus sp.]